MDFIAMTFVLYRDPCTEHFVHDVIRTKSESQVCIEAGRFVTRKITDTRKRRSGTDGLLKLQDGGSLRYLTVEDIHDDINAAGDQ